MVLTLLDRVNVDFCIFGENWAKIAAFSNDIALENQIWKMLLYWCCRRHKKKGKKWIKNKYFPKIKNLNWVFNNGEAHTLIKAASIRVKAHYYVKVKRNSSPFVQVLLAIGESEQQRNGVFILIKELLVKMELWTL